MSLDTSGFFTILCVLLSCTFSLFSYFSEQRAAEVLDLSEELSANSNDKKNEQRVWECVRRSCDRFYMSTVVVRKKTRH